MSRNREAAGDSESAAHDLDKFIAENHPKAIGIILRSTLKQLQREKGPKNLQSMIDYLRHFHTTLDTTTKIGKGVAERIDAKIIELVRVLKETHDKGEFPGDISLTRYKMSRSCWHKLTGRSGRAVIL